MKASIFTRHARRIILGGVMGGISIFVSQGLSAPIQWGSATTIAGDIDVITNGSLVAAYNFAGDAYTLNGVPFSANWTSHQFFDTTDSPVSLGIGAGSLSFSFTTGNFYAFPNTFGAGSSAPYSGLSTEYQALLAGAVFKDINPGVTDGFTMTWNELSIGQEYQVQLWTNDSREFGINRDTTFTAGNAVTLEQNTATAGSGGLGQWVTGTFTADAATQAIVVSPITNGQSPLISAAQLRAVPEPKGLPMLALLAGLAYLFATRGKKEVISPSIRAK